MMLPAMQPLLASLFGTLLALYIWETFKKSKRAGLACAASVLAAIWLASLIFKHF